MNKQRRKTISSIIEKLGEIQTLLEEVTEDEREAFENMPEGLQCSERGELMESAIDTLETHASTIEEMVSELEEL